MLLTAILSQTSRGKENILEWEKKIYLQGYKMRVASSLGKGKSRLPIRKALVLYVFGPSGTLGTYRSLDSYLVPQEENKYFWDCSRLRYGRDDEKV